MTIEQKIDFWRQVMRHAKDRGIDVYFVTWNIWMNSVAPPGWYRQQATKDGDAGKYGINNDQENPRTIAYLRACVREFILTYPGPGGNRPDRRARTWRTATIEYDREKWLWATYGEGVMDAKRTSARPRDRHDPPRLAERDAEDDDRFRLEVPDEINLSFKYARARLYRHSGSAMECRVCRRDRGLGM